MNPSDPIFPLQLAKDKGCGLCNQLYALAGCIDSFVKDTTPPPRYDCSDKIILVDSFLREIGTDHRSPIHEILDLHAINAFLFPTYRILVLDRNQLEITIQHLFLRYKDDAGGGNPNPVLAYPLSVSLKDEWKQPHGGIRIPKHESLAVENRYPVLPSYLEVHAKCNDHHVIFYAEVDPDGCLSRDFVLEVPDTSFPSPALYYGDSLHPFRFIRILQNIRFHSRFHTAHQITLQRMSLLSTTERKINVIHLRMEPDALDSFASYEGYSNDLGEKYIALIQKYIDPADLTIVISGEYPADNPVLKFLSDAGFHHVCSVRAFREREMNAIHDLLFYKVCTGCFLGVYESSFSYTFVFKLYSHSVDPTSVIFSLNDLTLPEKVFEKGLIY